jgi:hypothetical protein
MKNFRYFNHFQFYFNLKSELSAVILWKKDNIE